MAEIYRKKTPRPIHCLSAGMLCLSASLLTAQTAMAGFNVWPPPAEQSLDGQTTDWITITDNALGAGVGTLYGGSVNVGVEGLTNIGDLTIQNGGMLDADKIGAGSWGTDQYQGTINVGRDLVIRNGGQMFLNGDILNVLGWSTGVGGNATLSQNSSLSAINSTLTINGNRLNLYGTSGMALSNSSTLNVNELGLGGTNTLDVTDSTLNIANRFGIGLGTGNASAVTLTGSTVDALFGSIRDNATVSATGSSLAFRDNASIENATMTQNGGDLVFGDELFVRGGGSLAIDGATVRHQNLGDVDNRGAVVVHDGGQLALSSSTLDLVSGGGPANGQRVTVNTGGQVSVTGSTVTARTVTANTGGQVSVTGSTVTARTVSAEDAGSLYQQTGGTLNTLNLSSADAGEVRLNSTVVNATGNVTADGAFNATGTTLNVTGSFTGRDGVAGLTGSSLTTGGDTVLYDSSTLGIDNSTLTVNGNRLNLYGTSGVALSNSSILNVNELGLGGTNTLNVTDSTLNIAGRFGIGLGTGNASAVTLTGSTVDALFGSIRDNATVSATGSSLVFRDNASIENATMTQNGGDLVFGDELFVRGGGSLAIDGATVRHQNLGDVDNRGAVVVHDGGQLALSNSTLDLVSGGGPANGQRVTVNTGGQVSVADTSTVNAKDVSVDGTGSLVSVTDSTLTTESLTTINGGVFEETNSVINVTGNTTRIENGGQLTLNGGIYNEAGDFILSDSILEGTDPVMNIGGDFEVTGSSGIVFSDVAELFIGDDLLFDADTYAGFGVDSVLIYMLGASDDEGNGNILDLDGDFLLGGLNIGDSANLILTDNLLVNDLSFLGQGSVDLNGFDLTVVSIFSGDQAQIISSNGGNFNYNPNASVPEPAIMLLFGTGLGCLVGVMRKKRVGAIRGMP